MYKKKLGVDKNSMLYCRLYQLFFDVRMKKSRDSITVEIDPHLIKLTNDVQLCQISPFRE